MPPRSPRVGRRRRRAGRPFLGLLSLGAALLAAVPARASDPRFVVGRSTAIFQKHPEAFALRIGAWADASWTDNDLGPGSGEVNHANVLFDARWRTFQGFLEMEWEEEAGLDGSEAEREFEIEQAYLRFQPRDGFSLRLGRFNTPAGIWVPIHWAILMDTIEKPPHAANDLLPEQQIGLELAGTLFPGWLASLGGQLDYALFGGFGSEALDQERPEGATMGADVRVHLDERYLAGLTAYRQKNDEAKDRSEHNLLLYGEARLPGALTFRAEYLHQRRERPQKAKWAKTLDVGYAKLRWDFARWFYLNYRVSYGDEDGDDGRTALELINTFTLGVQPIPAVRVKLEYSLHELNRDREDFDFWGASLGVRF